MVDNQTQKNREARLSWVCYTQEICPKARPVYVMVGILYLEQRDLRTSCRIEKMMFGSKD